MVVFEILAVVFGVSMISLVGGILLLYKQSWAKFLSKYLISFAIGAMLAVAFLDLLPEAIESAKTGDVVIYTLIGMIIFYLGEKTLLWYHHHSLEHILQHEKTHPIEEKIHPVGYLLTIGDSFHNFLDGVIIAASFLVDVKLGLITSIAVFFHEVPQEIGDFAIMLHAKMSRKKVFLYNFFAQLMAVLGALVGIRYLPLFHNFQPIMLAFAAGGFIYIASTDLLPETHRETKLKNSIIQIILLGLGIALIWQMGLLLPE